MKLHIGNLPRTVTEQELKDFITPFAVPTSLEIVRNPAGESRGYGFAEFAATDEGQAVITGAHGKDLGGQSLTVAEARPRKAETRGPRP
jgi:RNA recognition motif-containing protein